MTPGGRQGPAPARRRSDALTADQVLDAAMEIVGTEGVDRLTIRGLAAKLGVAVTAIYWHVGDKQALLDGLADRIIDQMGEVSARGRTPESRLVSVGLALRRSQLERPDLVALVHRQGRIAALFQPARRVLVRELSNAGLGGADAAIAVQAILNLVVGSILIDRQVERQPTQREEPRDLWTPEDVPGTPELLHHLTQPLDEEELFVYTLRALVRALVEEPG
jgi:TetR/AcrR family transcriptional regulator, tetracycline repressor protein